MSGLQPMDKSKTLITMSEGELRQVIQSAINVGIRREREKSCGLESDFKGNEFACHGCGRALVAAWYPASCPRCGCVNNGELTEEPCSMPKTAQC